MERSRDLLPMVAGPIQIQKVYKATGRALCIARDSSPHGLAQYVFIVLMTVFEYESAWFNRSESVEVGSKGRRRRSGTGQAVQGGVVAD
jgi:hypothetical protein